MAIIKSQSASLNERAQNPKRPSSVLEPDAPAELLTIDSNKSGRHRRTWSKPEHEISKNKARVNLGFARHVRSFVQAPGNIRGTTEQSLRPLAVVRRNTVAQWLVIIRNGYGIGTLEEPATKGTPFPQKPTF